MAKESTLKSLRRLWPYIVRHKKPLLFGIFCVMTSNGMAIISPWVLQIAIDALRSGDKTYSFGMYSLMIIGATSLQATFLFLMRKVMIGVSRDIEYELRNDLYSHMQSLSTSWYNRMYTGDLMSRNNNDLSAVRMVLGPAIMYSVNTFFTGTFAITTMAFIDWKLLLLALSPLPLVSYLITHYGEIIHDRFKDVQEQFSQVSTMVQENLSGIKVVKAFGREQQEIQKFSAQNIQYMQLNERLVKVWGILYPLVQMLAGMGILIVIWYGGRAVIKGDLTLGELVAFNSYLAMLIWPAIALGWVVNITQRGAASMTRLNEVFDQVPEIVDPKTPAQSTDYKLRGTIEFKNVTFGYKPDKPILKKLSFVIPEGRTVSFVGATGAGKTTLLQLIPRLYDPDSGEVLIDEINVKDLPISVLRRQIGYVPQDAFLFSDSIQENIGYGVDEPSIKEVEEAAAVAAFNTEVESFPEKYGTVVGERGISLSGGQKQRATIARAVLKDPAILLFDDSFSNVDTQTEERILQALREFRRNRTCLIVSHRISTIQDSDWIYVLEDGAVLEQGKHDDLLDQRGIYFDLYQKQLIEEELNKFK